MQKVLIPLAKGFEEIEAVSCIDILRRAGLEVVTVYIGNSPLVCGDHSIKINADKYIDRINVEEFAAIVLPGGMPGSANLRDDSRVIEAINKIYENGGLAAAVCAAPIVLEESGLLQGKEATSYPGFDDQMSSCKYRDDEKVVVDERIVTARGPGVVFDFAYKVAELLLDKNKIAELKQAMIFDK